MKISIITIMILVTGCSFAFTEEPIRYGGGRVICSSNQAAPIIDTVLASLNGVVLLAAASSEDKETKDAALSSLISMAIYGASAIYGYNNTSECILQRSQAKRLINDRVIIKHSKPKNQINIGINNNMRNGCLSDRECKGNRICVFGRCKNNL